eukprot:scaffold230438_cov13-Tisochrysis_lutea.AAC.1
MMGGVEIDGVRVMPEEISTLEDTLRLRIVVGEGKKHEVSMPSKVYEMKVGTKMTTGFITGRKTR